MTATAKLKRQRTTAQLTRAASATAMPMRATVNLPSAPNPCTPAEAPRLTLSSSPPLVTPGITAPPFVPGCCVSGHRRSRRRRPASGFVEVVTTPSPRSLHQPDVCTTLR